METIRFMLHLSHKQPLSSHPFRTQTNEVLAWIQRCLDHATAAEGRCSGASDPAQPDASTRIWTKQRWSTFLQRLRKEVEVGEAPIELYLHGMEILSVQQDTKWVCLPDTDTDQDHASTNQRGASSSRPREDTKKTEVAHSFATLWITNIWKWLFGTAQDMREHAAWLHHVAYQIAPKVRPPPAEIKAWKREDRQSHQIAIKDIWGAHLRQVEHLITNANAPKCYSTLPRTCMWIQC